MPLKGSGFGWDVGGDGGIYQLLLLLCLVAFGGIGGDRGGSCNYVCIRMRVMGMILVLRLGLGGRWGCRLG